MVRSAFSAAIRLKSSIALAAIVITVAGCVSIHPQPPLGLTAGGGNAGLRVGSVSLHHCFGGDYYCGAVRVALDPAGRVSGSIDLAIAWLPHSDRSAPSAGTIVAVEGGPGYAIDRTRDRCTVRSTRRCSTSRDMLLVDNRGTGSSGAIVCRAPAARTAHGAAVRHAVRPRARPHVGPLLNRARRRRHGRRSHGAYASARSICTAIRTARSSCKPSRDAIPIAFDRSFSTAPTKSWAAARGIRAQVRRFAARSTLRAHVRRSARSLRGSSTRSDRAFAREASRRVADRISPAQRRVRNGLGWARSARRFAISTPRRARTSMQTTQLRWQRLVDRDLRRGRRRRRSGARLQSGPLRCGELLRQSASLRHAPRRRRSALPTGAHALALKRAQRSDALRAVLRWTSSSHIPIDYAYVPLCTTWPVASPKHPAGQPVPPGTRFPAVPVLVLNGDLDTTTTPAEGANEPRRCSLGATHVIVANSVHVTALDDFYGCASAIVRRFTLTRRVDAGCAAHVPALHLVPAFSRTIDDGWRRRARSRIIAAPVKQRRSSRGCRARRSRRAGAFVRVRLSAGSGPARRIVHRRNAEKRDATGATLSAIRWTNDLAVSGTAAARMRGRERAARISTLARRTRRHVSTSRGRPPAAALRRQLDGTIDGYTLHATMPAL